MADALTTDSKTNICVICQTLTDNKPKPGILPCLGCQQLFCYQHIGQHRQYLTDHLKTVVVNVQNDLSEIISKLEENWDQYSAPQLREIDDWERKSYEVIKVAADNARQKLHEMVLNEFEHLRAQFFLLSKELTDTQEADNYFEKDIETLKNKFHQLKHDIENMDLIITSNIELQEINLINVMKKPTNSDCFIDRLLSKEKPSETINIPNRGKMYVIEENLLAFEDLTVSEVHLYNTVDESLKTISRYSSGGKFLGCSTYLKSFIYAFPNHITSQGCLRQWNMISDEESTFGLQKYQQITAAGFYQTNMLLVLAGQIIEKWNLKNVEFDTCWRKPISCEENETISMIEMNSKYYALVIKDSCGTRFQLRTHTMSIIGDVKIEVDVFSSVMSLPNESGWLWTNQSSTEKKWFVIDNQLKKHEQKYLLELNVEDIVVHGTNVIIHYGHQTINGTKRRSGRVEFYRWK